MGPCPHHDSLIVWYNKVAEYFIALAAWSSRVSCVVIYSPVNTGIILCMRPANGRRRYIVMSSPIGCAGNQSKRPHSKMVTTRTATLSGITTRTATLLWSKRLHWFGQNGHINWIATKTATLHLVKTATLFLVKTATGRISSERGRFGYQNGLTAFGQNGHTLFGQITNPKFQLLPIIS